MYLHTYAYLDAVQCISTCVRSQPMIEVTDSIGNRHVEINDWMSKVTVYIKPGTGQFRAALIGPGVENGKYGYTDDKHICGHIYA